MMLLRSRQTIDRHADWPMLCCAVIAFGRPDLFIRINNRQCLVRTIRHFLPRHPTYSFLCSRRSICRRTASNSKRIASRARHEIHRVTINSLRANATASDFASWYLHCEVLHDADIISRRFMLLYAITRTAEIEHSIFITPARAGFILQILLRGVKSESYKLLAVRMNVLIIFMQIFIYNKRTIYARKYDIIIVLRA